METEINNRRIELLEYFPEEDWFNRLPSKNWLCILLTNDTDRKYINELITKIIEKNVCYVCSIGMQCEKVHDLIDEEISFRETSTKVKDIPSHFIMTTWHNNFEEGIWFAFFAAQHEEVEIEKVIIIDMTNGQEIERLENTLYKIKNEG